MPDSSGRSPETRNRLLGSLGTDALALLQRHLQLGPYKARHVAIEAGAPIERVLFPVSGVVSLVSAGPPEIEVGLVGREGFVGHPLLLGADRTPLRATWQIAGEALAMPAAAFREALARSEPLRASLSRYVHSLNVQTATTACAYAQLSIDKRLARWLLMTQDRIGLDEIPLTHELLATMLSVRRPGVTIATHLLEGQGAIRARRGLIAIRDRDKLRALAGDCYGTAEAEWSRLLDGPALDGPARPVA